MPKINLFVKANFFAHFPRVLWANFEQKLIEKATAEGVVILLRFFK